MGVGQVPQYPVGSLVRIRERDWVVLPSYDADILCLRPLSGSESEIRTIYSRLAQKPCCEANRKCVAGRSAAWLNAKVVASVRIAKRESSFVIDIYLPPGPC